MDELEAGDDAVAVEGDELDELVHDWLSLSFEVVFELKKLFEGDGVGGWVVEAFFLVER